MPHVNAAMQLPSQAQKANTRLPEANLSVFCYSSSGPAIFPATADAAATAGLARYTSDST